MHICNLKCRSELPLLIRPSRDLARHLLSLQITAVIYLTWLTLDPLQMLS